MDSDGAALLSADLSSQDVEPGASQVVISEETQETSSAEKGTEEQAIRNYEVNETIQSIVGSVGSIQRLSMALTIDETRVVIDPEGNYIEEPRADEEITQLRELSIECPNIEGVIIGKALYENNIASIEDELCQINSSNADYYFPHPKDSKSKLDQIKKSIKIMYVDILVEEYLELHGFKCLIGFSSSVLFNFKESNIKLIPVKYKNNWLGKDCEIAYKILKNYI